MKPWHWALIFAGAVIVAVYVFGKGSGETAAIVATGAAAEGARRFRQQRLRKRREAEARELEQHEAEAQAARAEPLSLSQAERMKNEAERW